jgi:hypothetical protein
MTRRLSVGWQDRIRKMWKQGRIIIQKGRLFRKFGNYKNKDPIRIEEMVVEFDGEQYVAYDFMGPKKHVPYAWIVFLQYREPPYADNAYIAYADGNAKHLKFWNLVLMYDDMECGFTEDKLPNAINYAAKIRTNGGGDIEIAEKMGIRKDQARKLRIKAERWLEHGLAQI